MTKTVTDFPNVTASRRGCKPGTSKKSANITSELRAERKFQVGFAGLPPLKETILNRRIGAYDVIGGSEFI